MAKKGLRRGSKKDSTRDGSCFVIMPFGGWFDDYYTTIFAPAIEKAGLEARRADDLYRPSTIVADIWSYTNQAKVILADLTGKNPNVFYELGLAHALAKPAVLVAESMEDVPFDLRALRILTYNKNDPTWGIILRDKIGKSIREVAYSAPLERLIRPDSSSRSDRLERCRSAATSVLGGQLGLGVAVFSD